MKHGNVECYWSLYGYEKQNLNFVIKSTWDIKVLIVKVKKQQSIDE